MNSITYFDNAATTFPKPNSVYTAMDSFARNCGVSTGRGQHVLSARASHLADETRELLLELFHCSNKKIVFTNTATEAINLVLRGIPIPSRGNLYISPFEHNAVTRTLHSLAKENCFSIWQLAVNRDTLTFDQEEIARQFTKNAPHCVIVSHVSNVTGGIAPITDIFRLAKQYHAITCADMCQSAGLIDTDISSSIFDYVVFAGHKTLYGPLGVSGLISCFPHKLPPLITGGTGIESANQDMPKEIPIQYEAGSHNSTAIAGLHAALSWIRDTGIKEIYRTEVEHRKRLISLLQAHANIRIINPEQAVSVVSCHFEGYSSDEIGQVLSSQGIAVRTGLHCAPLAHQFLGTFPSGTVRFSVGYHNSDSDFEKLGAVLDYIEENS